MPTPTAPETAPDRRKLARLAWWAVAANVAVILWGSVVRATGSGAGCGSHWPLCNGEVIPPSPGAATLIEFGHRTTSGLALLFVFAVALLAFRATRARGPGDRAIRRWAALSAIFMAGEAAIGAGIVLLRYVGADDSPERAAWMGLHLVNTFLLLASLTLLAERLARTEDGSSLLRRDGLRRGRGLVVAGIAGLLLAGATGAIAALGDTLFPASSLREGLAQDVAAGSHFLLQLRTLHPLIAVAAAFVWLHLAQDSRRKGGVGAAARPVLAAANAVTGLVFLQLLVGLVNLGLLAPLALQLLHLLLADLLWIAGVLLLDRRTSLPVR